MPKTRREAAVNVATDTLVFYFELTGAKLSPDARRELREAIEAIVDAAVSQVEDDAEAREHAR